MPTPHNATVAGFGMRIFLQGAHDTEQRYRHDHRKRRVLGVHEHVAVVKRAGREQKECNQAGQGSADPAPQPPGYKQANQAHGGAHEASRLERTERKNLRGERGEKIKPAPVLVQIDE